MQRDGWPDDGARTMIDFCGPGERRKLLGGDPPALDRAGPAEIDMETIVMERRLTSLDGRPGVLLLLLGLAAPALAHHANSAYDRTITISVTGVVTRWQFINPHAGLFLEVADEQGNVTEWSAEFQSIQDLYRSYGWNKYTFKPGDEVTVFGSPDRRDGHHSMWTSRVVMPDGTEVDVRNVAD